MKHYNLIMSPHKDTRKQNGILFFEDAERIAFKAVVVVKTMRFSVEKIISLSGISDIKIGQKSDNFDANIASKGGKSNTVFARKTVSDSSDFAIKDIAVALFILEI